MKTVSKFLALSLLMTATSGLVCAAEGDNSNKPATQTTTKKVLNPWVDCGIGAMLFSETDWAAVTSNIIWDLGTTAVTSDYSSQNTCNSKKAQTALYIGATYANLEEDTVKGDGDHVHAMLNLMGCNPSAHDAIIGSVRASFIQNLQNTAFSEKTTSAKAQDYYDMVNTNIERSYAGQCQAL